MTKSNKVVSCDVLDVSLSSVTITLDNMHLQALGSQLHSSSLPGLVTGLCLACGGVGVCVCVFWALWRRVGPVTLKETVKERTSRKKTARQPESLSVRRKHSLIFQRATMKRWKKKHILLIKMLLVSLSHFCNQKAMFATKQSKYEFWCIVISIYETLTVMFVLGYFRWRPAA